MIVGIDIGSSTSPMAVAVLDEGEVVETLTLKQKAKVPFPEFLALVYGFIVGVVSRIQPSLVTVEETYFHGIQYVKNGVKRTMPLKSANQRHQRLIGTIMVACQMSSRTAKVLYVAPTSIKKRITGSGKADKIQVAKALKAKVSNPELITELIEDKRWDETDAIAIALSGLFDI